MTSRTPLSRTLVALAAAASLAATAAGALPASAEQLAVPTSVTVAGSLQSELGCTGGDAGGDWLPGCALTDLADRLPERTGTSDAWSQVTDLLRRLGGPAG